MSVSGWVLLGVQTVGLGLTAAIAVSVDSRARRARRRARIAEARAVLAESAVVSLVQALEAATHGIPVELPDGSTVTAERKDESDE